MKHFIELADNEILEMDDNTGDIVILLDYLPGGPSENDEVEIHYMEDPEDIAHTYKVTNVDADAGTVRLDWVQQLGESLLTEANPLMGLADKIKDTFDSSKLGKRVKDFKDTYTSPNLAKTLTAAEKRAKRDTERAENQNKHKQNDLIARDLSAEAKTWKFYLQDTDGSYNTYMTQQQVLPIYKKMKSQNYIPSEISNAIVVDEDGYIVRRGFEDLYGEGVKYKKPTQKTKKTTKQPSDNTDKEKQEKTDATEADTKNKPEKTETPETGSKNKTDHLGISRNTYSHFLKILYVMRPKLFDAFDKPVDVSDIRTLNDKVKYNNLADFEIEIDGKRVPAIKWIKTAVKNKVLMEKVLKEAPVIQLDADDIIDPKTIDFKDKMKTAYEKEQAEIQAQLRAAEEEKMKELHKDMIEDLAKRVSRNDSVEEILNFLFEHLVPPSGPADTVAGELVRAIVRLMYRDSNDGDKFFEGYGIDTCGSSAEYLFDQGFNKDIDDIINTAYSMNDDMYTDKLTSLGKNIIDTINSNPSLLWTVNEEDSRDYSTEYIEANQPRYEFELYGSDDIVTLVEKGVLTAWDLNNYVEDQLSYESRYFDGATVSRPWTHYSTSVTVENLTKDGYDYLHDSFSRDPDGWWSDLTSEYSDDLDDSEYDDDYDEV